jgi:hypothetical protein
MTGLYYDICLCGHSIDDHFNYEAWEEDEFVINSGYCLEEDCTCEIYKDITDDDI